MRFDVRRALRGAAAGAIAGVIWAAQQDVDKRVFGIDYDDTELLGKFVTRGAAWRPIGIALHVANGAAFGAVYATVTPRVSGPGWAKGAAAGLAENFVSWPLVSLVDDFHPARKELPDLKGNQAALAQATWRHLLFGFVLGALEERFNGAPSDRRGTATPPASSNGHGDISRASVQGQAE
jgi:hypothetical protein